MMWYWGGGGVHWWAWFVGAVLTVGFWALLILLIVSMFRYFATKDHYHEGPDREEPERALARRFANGEIDEEEFHRRLEVLRSHVAKDKT